MTIHVSAKHKIVGVPYAPEVANLIPRCRDLTLEGNRYLAVPHGPTETYLLRRLGFDAPSPILTQYDWPHPIGFPPFEVQKTTCDHLTMNPRAYVLNDMGTGKTRSALWAWDFLYANKFGGKALILAPLSTLTFVWAREVLAVLPHRKIVVLHGPKKRRLERLADPEADLFVINHDGLKIVYDELSKRKDINVLIIDELAVYRNGGAARTKLLRKYAEGMAYVWGMTGSPIPTSPTDAWAQATIVTPNTVPKYFGRFRDELMTKVSQFKYVPKKDAVDRAFSALQPAVRYTLDDVVELPEIIERFVDVDLGPQQRKVYEKLVKEAHALVQSQEITAANAGAVMMKLLQVSTGWVYTSTGNPVALDNLERIEALMDGINSTSRKVLVFSPFKHALAGISEALKKEGIEHATVSGDTPASERAQTFNLFQNTNKYRVINAHPQCLAHGVTLTAADTIIWFAPVTSLEIYDQANRRIRRVGQKHKQLILHLQSTPVERRIYAMLQQHQQVQNQLLSLFEEASA